MNNSETMAFIDLTQVADWRMEPQRRRATSCSPLAIYSAYRTKDFIDRSLPHHHPPGMKKSLIVIAGTALFAAWAGLCSAQSDAPYTEGTVWNVTMVKTKYGMGDQYLKGLAKTFKGSLDEAKKQNLIISYKILLGDAATPQDFDILLMVESKNMAALDNAREKFDPIAKKIEGPVEEQEKTATKRLDIREIMGDKLMREITLK